MCVGAVTCVMFFCVRDWIRFLIVCGDVGDVVLECGRVVCFYHFLFFSWVCSMSVVMEGHVG